MPDSFKRAGFLLIIYFTHAKYVAWNANCNILSGKTHGKVEGIEMGAKLFYQWGIEKGK